jgi:imidazoleglycerol-phosphate dehydratase
LVDQARAPVRLEVVAPARRAVVARKTKETEIEVEVCLDGTGAADIATGIGFFDHMLEQLAKHSGIDTRIKARGDLHIDPHHTVEDTGIALGQAIRQALGDMAGIRRFADVLLPMDETLTRVAVDASGRPFLVFRTRFERAKIGSFDTELVREFFQAFTTHAGMNIHVETLYGENSHHIAESSFKGLARCLEAAIARDERRIGVIPSTKGILGG